MSNKAYYLATCDTCKRILKEIDLPEDFILREIKSEMYTEEELDAMYQFTNSYEALLNKRARKYKEQGIKEKNLSDMEFKEVILSDYTFLKRPVFLFDDKIFVGNTKKEIEALKNELQG